MNSKSCESRAPSYRNELQYSSGAPAPDSEGTSQVSTKMFSHPAWFRPGDVLGHSPTVDVRRHAGRLLTRRKLHSILVVLATVGRPVKYFASSPEEVMRVPNLLKSVHNQAMIASGAIELPTARWLASGFAGGRPTTGRGGVIFWPPALLSMRAPHGVEVMRGERECGNVRASAVPAGQRTFGSRTRCIGTALGREPARNQSSAVAGRLPRK
jgi:hypothetical protein